ncbi:class I SAM-dependent methyltransferase [Phaeobacter gallaeciensis]|uniref:class I SAM-dependent methyltransferase n=1 Tax=Phaeobacter gallaeciensis TaxID=60890 RepID=UPI00237F45E4|nr:SAM-dependent methyltransferase [Phaeobacter gallaeciensis]MDE4097673.1 SAM-dependent methyltransferase [Phaeobacter gallaeciensis]MDE4106489.1 SAM-dependent methyltransferase [Phaeobacter gallaeciensis]MDE4110937.1 SAM-dependent methyltransferase [Phaeobacter gallaeciensis]MDE4115414.1 SAM-dependent methyltransferase [Phaeobacter gallaeciensis]MDE4119884.1 SAM-dependent methyltransferase [Phaeobacter gallaeciensis]
MSLLDHLIARIDVDGPMSLADYMAECLLNPRFGYYTTRDPLGAAGDFTTAPEISQMFGELLGLCLAQSWLDQGAPAPFTLAELGPGRGTLMADLLRATRAVPGFHAALELHLVEASPTLREAQAKALTGFEPIWHDTIDSLPQQPLFLVANEFFDALPVRQFLRDGTGWREKRIGMQNGTLTFGLGPVTEQPALSHRLEDTREGDLVELCEGAAPVTAAIATRIAAHGGAALIVDYGDWRSLGDTLQALRDHAPCDPLEAPGSADLTTHVDFEVLTQAAQAHGCAATRLTPQGVFLERLGITDRARALAAPLNGDALDNLIAAHRRLTHPEEMGNLFKVLGLYPGNATPPPGLQS